VNDQLDRLIKVLQARDAADGESVRLVPFPECGFDKRVLVEP
jgi:hypothetical protein